MLMPGRKYSATSSYRYGFNGKENDSEVKGEGNEQDYGMRIYDPRLGKFLSVDPLIKKYPELTPYQFASNTPIQAVDLDGMEAAMVMFPKTASDKDKNDFYKAYDKSLTKGAIAVGVVSLVVADHIFTGGQITRTTIQVLGTAQLFSLFYHNKATTPQQAADRKYEFWHGALNLGIGWGFAKVAGKTIVFFTPIKEEFKYLFRGTSEGFEGSAAVQKAGYTPTSVDPAIATVFATLAKNYGKGELQIALTENLQGVGYDGNVMASVEREIALNMKPAEFATKISLKISADQARQILSEMGIKIPTKINSLGEVTEIIKTTPKMTQGQIDEFYKKATSIK
jgi:RHS repeat-associated protein